MSQAADELAFRIETLLGPRPEMVQKRMFGGVAFMLRGNMLCGPMKEGTLMARVGPDLMAEALTRPGAQQMQMGGRTMKGYVEVESDAIEDDDALVGWLTLCEQFVGSLPPK